MNTKKCPNCKGRLIKDAAEEMYEKEDGTFVLDSFLAYVCVDCGYAERVEDTEDPDS